MLELWYLVVMNLNLLPTLETLIRSLEDSGILASVVSAVNKWKLFVVSYQNIQDVDVLIR